MPASSQPPQAEAPAEVAGRMRTLNPWVCVLVNQLACPGLGTLMAGRKVGYVQAGLMVLGFGLVLLFMAMWLGAVLRLASDLSWTEEQYRTQVRAWRWALVSGAALCGLAWGWALASSIAIVRRSKETAAVQAHSAH